LTQKVCGDACRAARDRQLARARRRRELADYRADERRRQQAVRDQRAEARAKGEAAPAEGAIGEARHAPASAAKSAESLKEIAQIVDRTFEASRASLLRDLSRKWPHLREILATDGTASRASFRGQVPESPAKSGADRATRHT